MLKTIKLSEIISLSSWNSSRIAGELGYFKEIADRDNLVCSLAQGFDIGKGLIVVAELTDEEKADALKVRDEFIQSIEEWKTPVKVKDIQGKTDTEISADTQKIVCRKMFQRGKTIQPKYGVVSGNRRFMALYFANILRHIRDIEMIDSLTVSVEVFETERDRIIRTIEENEKKFEGSLGTSVNEKLQAALTIFQKGGKESHLKGAFKRGTSQKLWAICGVNHALENTFIPWVMEDTSRYGSLSKETMRKALTDGKTGDDLFKVVTAVKKNAVKIASKDDILRITTQNPVRVFQIVAQAILNNDVGVLEQYNAFADEMNKAFKAICKQ